MPSLIYALLLFLIAAPSIANPVGRATAPAVVLDKGTFIGVDKGLNFQFLGLPFTQPVSGKARLHLPQLNLPYTGVHDATTFGPGCLQQATPTPTLVPGSNSSAPPPPTDEECLTINVITPASSHPNSKFPVAVWIYGGGFETGMSSSSDGGMIVNRSIELSEPVVYVSMNYRLNGFGFLSSREVRDAGLGNLGLHDQREALRWIQKYIRAFGDDPAKVTIWGESAGAISVGSQMMTNGGNTEGLFRGAFMESGSPNQLASDITAGQVSYDHIIADTGCASSSDTLECLRTVPAAVLLDAINKTPNIFSPAQALNLTWEPRVDGVFFTESGVNLVAKGSVADVPIVSGDCDDEGTIFSVVLTNITTDEEALDFISTNFFPAATVSRMKRLLDLYPQDPAAGSPFDTGDQNALTPQYKRLAALQANITFQAPRRFLFEKRVTKQPVYSFLSKRGKSTPFVGAFHSSDLQNVYGGGELTDYLVHFVNNLDPNGLLVTGKRFYWPRYDLTHRQLLTLLDAPLPALELTADTYREDAMKFVADLITEREQAI
ncbi:carotenoid ester lipase [Punctularia strigosozonata HHB-11173 SS5]|uniref:carotenoid ester lipase n=1 Tax=Punctularia strigosozonata (strain HHB-11173) TaxID=741275 RepID=UPI0004418233|nr:carotenoid ester lipase [Punctularia strigosozonata HHB-11173 SS5]EIN05435.1 carotenoid ester lipase [Punctularia strigosozonata HHB-11173 SS5]